MEKHRRVGTGMTGFGQLTKEQANNLVELIGNLPTKNTSEIFKEGDNMNNVEMVDVGHETQDFISEKLDN